MGIYVLAACKFGIFSKIGQFKLIDDFQNFRITQPKSLDGVLAPNKYLEKPDILYKGQILGPEHILERDGVFYTSLATGEVVKIVDGKVEIMSQFGKYCRK